MMEKDKEPDNDPKNNTLSLHLLKASTIVKKETCIRIVEDTSSCHPTESPIVTSSVNQSNSNVKVEVLDDASFLEDEGGVGTRCSDTTACTKQELDIGPTELQPPDMFFMLQSCKPDPDYDEPLKVNEYGIHQLLVLKQEGFTQQSNNDQLMHNSPESLRQGERRSPDTAATEAPRTGAEPARLVRSLLYAVAGESAVCRLCCAGAGAVSLHDEVSLRGTADTMELSDVLLAVAGSTIDKDALPAMLCLACTDAAVSSYKFLQLCHGYSSTLTSLAHLVQTAATEVSSELQRPDAQSLFLLVGDSEIVIDTSDKINDTKIALGRLEYLFSKKKKLNIQRNHCGKIFRKKQYSKNHSVKCTEIFDQNGLPHEDSRCPYDGCFKTFKNRSTLKMHMQMHEVKTYPCNICNKKYGSLVFVDEHKRHVHKYQECHVCKECFIGFGALMSHKKTCHKLSFHDPRYYTLEKASNGSKRGDSLNEKNNLMCDKCDKNFGTKLNMVRHQIICTGKLGMNDLKGPKEGRRKTVQCDICKMFCKGKHILKNHIERVHLGKKGEFPCSVCGKHFHRNNELKRHMITHTRERPELCTVCGRRFVNKAALLYHTRLHTGERPYPCALCGERFLSSSRRGDHMRVRHGTHPQCPVCHKSFTSNRSMKKHVRQFHSPG